MENQLRLANDLRKQGNYAAAISCYEEAINSPENGLNKWDIWGYAYSLRKAGDADKAIIVSEKYLPEYPDLEILKNNLAWAYFDKYIRNFNPDEMTKTEKGLERIYQLNGQQVFTEDKNIPCPFTIGVFKVLKHYKKPRFHTAKIRYWIDKIDPEKLSRREQNIIQEGRERKLASDYESYYSLLIPLLFNEAKYTDCIDIAEHVLNSISPLHYDNAVWFQRRIALCHAELGDFDKAKDILQSLDQGKGEKWFIEFELSRIYFEQENYAKSLHYAVKAAKNPGDDLMKVNLYTHLARIFFKLNQKEEARLHALLVVAIKQANSLDFDAGTQKLIAYFRIDSSVPVNLKSQKRAIDKIWNTMLYADQPSFTGKITKILPTGKAGFIRRADGKDSYYFEFREVRFPRHLIQEEKSVRFFLAESYDKKKEKKSLVAVEIYPLNC